MDLDDSYVLTPEKWLEQYAPECGWGLGHGRHGQPSDEEPCAFWASLLEQALSGTIPKVVYLPRAEWESLFTGPWRGMENWKKYQTTWYGIPVAVAE